MTDVLVARYHEYLPIILGLGYSPLYDLRVGMDIEILATEIAASTEYYYKNFYRLGSKATKVPPGSWYAYCVTTPEGKDEAHCVHVHELSMAFFRENNIDVVFVALEKSNIWHTHGLINLGKKPFAKNLKRDLSKACLGYRVEIERKITSDKLFAGACNYIAKRGYDDDNTHVRFLVEEIHHEDGKGWVLNN